MPRTPLRVARTPFTSHEPGACWSLSASLPIRVVIAAATALSVAAGGAALSNPRVKLLTSVSGFGGFAVGLAETSGFGSVVEPPPDSPPPMAVDALDLLRMVTPACCDDGLAGCASACGCGFEAGDCCTLALDGRDLWVGSAVGSPLGMGVAVLDLGFTVGSGLAVGDALVLVRLVAVGSGLLVGDALGDRDGLLEGDALLGDVLLEGDGLLAGDALLEGDVLLEGAGLLLVRGLLDGCVELSVREPSRALTAVVISGPTFTANASMTTASRRRVRTAVFISHAPAQ